MQIHKDSKDNRSPLDQKLYIPKTNYEPEPQNWDVEDYLHETGALFFNTLKHAQPSSKGNISSMELNSLRELASNPDIRIINTDKGAGPCIVNTSDYLLEAYRQLNDASTYQKLTAEDALAMVKNTVLQIEKIATNYKLDKQHLLFFQKYFTPIRHPNLYLLAKLHKPAIVGTFSARIICPAHSWVTTGPAKFIDAFLQPYVKSLPTVLTDSTSLLRILQTLKIPAGAFLVTADVESLYPSIPLDFGMQAFRKVLQNIFKLSDHHVNLLCDYMLLTLKNNIVTFKNEFYLQIKGTAMGCPAAVVFAQIVMYALEQLPVSSLKPLLYKRYIDDIFAIVRSLEEAKALISKLNSVHSAFKITPVYSDEKVNFLDLIIYKDPLYPDRLQTKPYTKPNNPFLYLPESSAHPLGVKKGFIKGRLIALIRSSSTLEAYLTERNNFIRRLRVRGYSFQFLLPIINSVSYANRTHYLKQKEKKTAETTSPLVLVLPYNQRTLALRPSSLVQKYWSPTFSTISTRFSRPPLICYKRSHSLRHYIKIWSPQL